VNCFLNQTHNRIAKAIDSISESYSMGGFHVSRIHMDGKFKRIQEKILGQNIWVNITSRNEHVPEIERYIWTVKERQDSCSMYYLSRNCQSE